VAEMTENARIPALKTVLGAMVFGANRPLGVAEMKRCLADTAAGSDGSGTAFAGARESDIHAALEEVKIELERAECGFALREIAGGFALQSDASCGAWLRQLLDAEKPRRLSQPALETLAIVAYRQPATRAEIEAIRGVTVDHVLKALMEMELVRITGRSDLPGRPFLYGTTRNFLEHFGLKDLADLAALDHGRAAGGKAARTAEAAAARAAAKAGAAASAGPEHAESGAAGDAEAGQAGSGQGDVAAGEDGADREDPKEDTPEDLEDEDLEDEDMEDEDLEDEDLEDDDGEDEAGDRDAEKNGQA